MKKNISYKIIESWANADGNVNSFNSILSWVKDIHEMTYVKINECDINEDTFWFYDDYNGEITNRKRSFFSIKGMRWFEDHQLAIEQPIIIQPEIGYLGIICKEINGVINFLMQAKIEPGNVNCVQISPTIQATKSNFTRAHGGRLPHYFEYFEHSNRYFVIYDQIQSEQGARFYKKRNRNIIILINEDIEVLPNFKWMTLGQIKRLMDIDNLVNMDTRTVLSGIPLMAFNASKDEKELIKRLVEDDPLFKSFENIQLQKDLPNIFWNLNNYKMYRESIVTPVPLNQLVDWVVDDRGVTCKKQADFLIRYYKIEISGREVREWIQPLLKSVGMATFGLLTRVKEGQREFLVKIKPEIGTFDKVEIGPSIQWEFGHYFVNDDVVGDVFRKYTESTKGVLCNVVLSEEGGRFYHEENRNYIVEVEENELKTLPDGYVWVNYFTLNYLIQINNCINIQLRNLISLIKL